MIVRASGKSPQTMQSTGHQETFLQVSGVADPQGPRTTNHGCLTTVLETRNTPGAPSSSETLQIVTYFR